MLSRVGFARTLPKGGNLRRFRGGRLTDGSPDSWERFADGVP